MKVRVTADHSINKHLKPLIGFLEIEKFSSNLVYYLVLPDNLEMAFKLLSQLPKFVINSPSEQTNNLWHLHILNGI